MHRFSPIRAASTIIVIVGVMSTLIGRVAYLQTYGREQTIRKAEGQQHQGETLVSRRGCIWDRAGLLMAGTVQTTALFIDPKFMLERFQEESGSSAKADSQFATTLQMLAKLVDKDPKEVFKLLEDKYESRYIKIAENLDDQVVTEVAKLKLPGVGFTPTNVRQYPMASIAAHILGGVGSDGVGLDGLELQFEKSLAGKDGYKRTLKDARRRAIAVNAEDYLPPQNGQHLVLTIDSTIQMIAEQELAIAGEKHGADRAECVIMDPKTGEIYAMANWPVFNPQNLGDSKPEIRRNRCVTDPYEAGSAIKPFVVGPAMMWNLTRASEVFPIDGMNYKSSLRPKLVTDVHGYKNLTLWDVLVKSSNIGMTMLGEHMGKDRVYNALKLWHIGERTGVDLPGEDPGLLKPIKSWANSDIVSAVQGYSLMVTPLQLARNMCAYSNGGRLVTPRIIQGVLNENGEVISRTAPQELKNLPEVVDPNTALQMRRILADVPLRGTATGARSATWNVYGKTGTAHVASGGKYEDRYNATFVGGAPFETPRLVIAIAVHDPDPKKVHYGGTICGPAARRILTRSLAYLQEPASPNLTPPPPQIAAQLWNPDPKLYTTRVDGKDN